MSKSIKNVIMLISILLTIVVGYYFFSLNGSSVLRSGDALVRSNVELQNQEFISRLQELQSMKLGTEIIKDTRLQGLVDFSTAVEEVPVGRTNPFAEVN